MDIHPQDNLLGCDKNLIQSQERLRQEQPSVSAIVQGALENAQRSIVLAYALSGNRFHEIKQNQ